MSNKKTLIDKLIDMNKIMASVFIAHWVFVFTGGLTIFDDSGVRYFVVIWFLMNVIEVFLWKYKLSDYKIDK